MKNFIYGLFNTATPSFVFSAGLYLAVSTAKAAGYKAVLFFILSTVSIVWGTLWIASIGKCILERNDEEKTNG